jgi:HlyD family secretion protein
VTYEAFSDAESQPDQFAEALNSESTPKSEEPPIPLIAEDEQELDPVLSTGTGFSGWRGMTVGIVIGVVMTIGGMGLASRQSTPTAQTPPANLANSQPAGQTVTVATVEMASVAQTLDATGTVAAHDMLPVLPKAAGLQIKQVLVDEGEFVEAGQIMAILDDSVLQTQIQQANAQVEAARSVVGQRQAALQQAQAALQQAQAAKAEAQANFVQTEATLAQRRAEEAQAQREQQRYQDLAQEGAISRQDSETRTTTAQTAQEAVRVAQANIQSAQAKISSAEANFSSAQANVTSAQAMVDSAEADVRNQVARVEQLQTQLEQTFVRAPSSGIVAERVARVGDVSNGTQKLFSIIRASRLELQAKVPETQLPQIKMGAAAKITSDADSRIQLEGTVREIAPMVDEKNRQATVKIDLPASELLKPGMFLRAAITSSTTQGFVVPAKAVVPQSNGTSIVYLLQPNNTVKSQPVEVGEIISGNAGDLSTATVEIKKGLNAGQKVVIAGAGYLKDGDAVKVVENASVTQL